VGSIHRATVVGIESYGCFVKFVHKSSTISGLVHISQLCNSSSAKITNVNDVVSLDDQVFVKVMALSIDEQSEDDERRQSHKVSLTMKHVNQDTGQDLDPDATLMIQDLFRSHRPGKNINGGAVDEDKRKLASTIGMSSAIDPGSLILKGRTNNTTTSYNGYSLVDEDEGEMILGPYSNTTAAVPVRPMGRGKATTLPAWMTRQDDEKDDSRLGTMKDAKGPEDKDKYSSKYDDDGSKDRRHHRKKSSRSHNKHKDDRKHRRGRSRSSSSRKHSCKSRKHHKKQSRRGHSNSRKRSRSNSCNSSSSYYASSYSKSLSRSPSSNKNKKKKKKKRSKHHRRHHHYRENGEEYSNHSRCRRTNGDDRGGGSSSPSGFANVEEARAIMERLERRQKKE
jgi:predicted RNA-binding protein with RPS1 domain